MMSIIGREVGTFCSWKRSVFIGSPFPGGLISSPAATSAAAASFTAQGDGQYQWKEGGYWDCVNYHHYQHHHYYYHHHHHHHYHHHPHYHHHFSLLSSRLNLARSSSSCTRAALVFLVLPGFRISAHFRRAVTSSSLASILGTITGHN